MHEFLLLAWGNLMWENLMGCVSLMIKSSEENSTFPLNALVMPKITSKVPSQKLNISKWNHLKDIDLADPTFFVPGEIDLLIGAELFFEVLRVGTKRGLKGEPIAQSTVFGFIVGGNSDNTENSLVAHVNYEDKGEQNIDKLLKAFWEVEQVPQCSKLTKDENYCEGLFDKTFKIVSGRPQVNLPFVVDSKELGVSKFMALNRLKAVEGRFRRDPKYYELYKNFMTEYEELGHMSEISNDDIKHCKYFLPHHGVLKESSSTTKLRVVFDGSAKTTNGKSLNDILLVGPTVQSSLYNVLIRFRKHKFVFTADVEKMYRQILVAPEDRPYQCILWRKNVDNPIKYYQLQTVTYGTASAPFLATRSIVEVANLSSVKYPTAASSIKFDMYVDDLMTGADNLEDAKILRTDISNILSSSGFQLRKWVTNFDLIVPSDVDYTKEISEAETDNVKVLGLNWDAKNDCFSFKVVLDSAYVPTKRKLLSESSRIFDPLGWLSPTTISIKIMFQKLWLQKLDWDDELSIIEARRWKKLRESLRLLEDCKIPRWLHTESSIPLEIHGFCDASQDAYAAAVYSRQKVNGVCTESTILLNFP